MALQQENHSLFVKVMRLSRPHLTRETPVTYTPYLSESPSFDKADIQSLFEVNQLLKLPSSFGNIYLGETFTSYLSISNESSHAVTDVSIKVELQTSSQRLVVVDTQSDPLPELKNNKSLEFIVNHEIKELGVHILVCSVNYNNTDGKKFLRKFYKFQVVNPLSVKTKVNTSSTGNGLFLEAQIQNLTSTSIFLERMLFETVEQFDLVEYNQLKGSQESVFGEDQLLGSQDIRQYLYRLAPRKEVDLVARRSAALGRLDIMWRSTFGGVGRLQTSQLVRKVLPQEELEVWIHYIPETIYLQVPFTVTLRVKNWKEEDFPLTLTVNRDTYLTANNVLLCESIHRNCGNIRGLSYLDIELEFLAVVPGFQHITGLVFKDSKTGIEKFTEKIGELFVLHSTSDTINSLNATI
jgi:hypothetical protein